MSPVLRILRLLAPSVGAANPLSRLSSTLCATQTSELSASRGEADQDPGACSTSTAVVSAWNRSHTSLPSAASAHLCRWQHHSRMFTTSSSAAHGGGNKDPNGESISVTYIDKDGKEITVRAHLGENLLQVAHENEIELEGACEGSLACSTCHVIVEDDAMYRKIPEPSEDELDMLDLAYGLSETSRLGCQVVATKELDGVRVRIPAASRNFYVDGHKPKPH